ncbi:MAG: hypothetical protein ACRYE9_03300 [Janthinobacterium lividum]
MKALASTIAELDSIGLLLNSLPQKTEQNLQNAVPAIAEAIERDLFSELGQKARECCDVVSKAMREADILFKRDLKNKLQILALSTVLSTCSSMAGCYYVMKKFPQRLFIETTGSINANNSSISVIGKSPITAGKNNTINQYKG